MRKSFDALKPAEKRNSRKKVLIIRLDVIGDFILWLDAAKELRQIFPQKEYALTLLGNSIWTDLAKKLPYFDDVWSVNRSDIVNNAAKFVELVRKLCSFQFDTVLHPVYSREFLFGDFFVWTVAAQEKIGMGGDLLNESRWQKCLGDRFYTHLISCPVDSLTELEHNAVFMRGIGLVGFRAGTPVLAPEGEHHVSLPDCGYFVVVPGAGVTSRRWPIENFATLIERIQATDGLLAVVCGGPAEEQVGKALEERAAGAVVNLAGKTSLSELVSIIAKARFLVGNETGAVHIAASVGTPSVCILGGGHFGRFIPYRHVTTDKRLLPVPVFSRMECFGCDWKCIHTASSNAAVPCIRNISVDEVLLPVLELIKLQKAN